MKVGTPVLGSATAIGFVAAIVQTLRVRDIMENNNALSAGSRVMLLGTRSGSFAAYLRAGR